MTFLEMLWFGDWLVMSSTGLFFVIATLTTANERYWWTTGSFVAYYAVLEFFTELSIFHWVINHPRDALLIVLAYLLIGAGYSVLKWWAFMHKVGSVLKTQKEKVGDNDWGKEVANSALNQRFGYSVNLGTLKARHHLDRLAAWIGYWPLSFIGTFFSDPLRQLVVWVAKSLNGVYNRNLYSHSEKSWYR